MRRVVAFAAAAVVAACGGSTEPGVKGTPKPDPYVTVRVRNSLDTTARPGRAMWHLYLLLSGPQANQNGIGYQGSMLLSDARLGPQARTRCLEIGADSVGQRLIAPFAIADTTSEDVFLKTRFDSIVTRWYNGDHSAPPTG